MLTQAEHDRADVDHTVSMAAVRPDDEPRRPWFHRLPTWAEAAVTAVLSGLLFVVGFGGGLSRLQNPLGGGDLLQTYAAARVWSEGMPYGFRTFGFPFGFERRYYPTSDGLPNAVAGLVAWATDNPFLGIHTAYALSFPVTALAALWVFRIMGMRGPWAVFGSLAVTFVPFHWYRLEHVYLSMMYSAVLGVGLALLVGTGAFERRLRERTHRLRFVLLMLFVVCVIATSGIYYACFTAVLCTVAAGWRLVRGARFRDLLLAVVPGFAVIGTLGAVLLPAVLYVSEHPPLDAVAERNVGESVTYAGALVLALLPAPISRIPGTDWLNAFGSDALDTLGGEWRYTEANGLSNYGSVATVAAILVVVVGGVIGARRRALRPAGTDVESRSTEQGGLGLVFLLIVTTLLFFIPWGLNYLFAYMVSPDLRAWNRILPMTFTLLFVAAGIMLRRWRPRMRPLVELGVLALALLVFVLDSVLPARGFFAAVSAQGTPFGQAGPAYADALNAAVPGDCGVFELPYFPYPEFPHKYDMGNYESLWPALTNPGKSWSGAAMKGTEASEWQLQLGDALEQRDIAPLAAGGFCAVHVDRRGYADPEAALVVADLTEWLGAPVATGLDGDWVAFAIPGPIADVADPEELKTAPGGIGTFYAPPRVTPGKGAPDAPVYSLEHRTWWLGQGAAGYDIASLPEGGAFSEVGGLLQAGDCGARDVQVTLRGDGQEVSQTVRAEPDTSTAFSLSLDQPVRDAELTLTTSPLTEGTTDPVCDDDPTTTGAPPAPEGDETPFLVPPRDPGAVALIDPRATP